MKLRHNPWIALTAGIAVLFGAGFLPRVETVAPEPDPDLDRQIIETDAPFLAKHANRFYHGMSLTTYRTESMSHAIAENHRVKTNILNVGRIVRTDGGRHQDLTFGYLPNLPEEPNLQRFNKLIDDELSQLINRHAKDTGTTYRPKALGLPDRGMAPKCGGTLDMVSGRERADLHHKKPLLLIDCDVTLASGSIVAQRMSVFIANGQGNQQSDRNLYVDLGRFLPDSDELENDHMVGDFSQLVSDYDEFLAETRTLIANRIVDGEASALVRDLDELVTLEQVKTGVERAVFSDEGDLIVPIESTSLEGKSHRLPMLVEYHESGFRLFAVASNIIQPALNDFGQRVSDAAADQEPSVLTKRSPAGNAHVNCSLVPCLAITFDDGPMGKKTETVLAALDKYDQAATFFVMGSRASNDPKTLRKIDAAGHEIGGHSWNHPVLTSLTDKQLKSQFTRTNKAITSAIGKNPKYFRPPYGIWSSKVLKVSGQAAILWNVDSDDWRGDPDHKYLKRSLKVAPGDIVLFHDVQSQTVKNIDKLLSEYTARGYSLVTISQLFQEKPLRAGSRVYSR